MRAITEIPAKTPRPIGKTDSFLPGRVNAAAGAALAAAAVPAGLAAPPETVGTAFTDDTPLAEPAAFDPGAPVEEVVPELLVEVPDAPVEVAAKAPVALAGTRVVPSTTPAALLPPVDVESPLLVGGAAEFPDWPPPPVPLLIATVQV